MKSSGVGLVLQRRNDEGKRGRVRGRGGEVLGRGEALADGRRSGGRAVGEGVSIDEEVKRVKGDALRHKRRKVRGGRSSLAPLLALGLLLLAVLDDSIGGKGGGADDEEKDHVDEGLQRGRQGQQDWERI